MPNDYFQFKQFLIKQDKCAMKVCTDACLFGAWAAEQIVNCQLKIENVLDIGTGTGLLSLMLAQKLPDVIIDAVEIDKAAAQQAKENFEVSKWKERLNVYHDSIQQFAETCNKKYDAIISNPPFYENDLKSNDARRNIALHSQNLKLEELVNISGKLLNDKGNFFVMMPYFRVEDFEELCEGKFFVREKVLVKQTARHDYFRSIICFIKQSLETHQSEIIIMNKHHYSKEFIHLLKDYYLLT